MLGIRCRIFVIAFLIVIFAGIPAHPNERVPIPDGLFYHRFASSEPGTEATWINPALLGEYQMISVQVLSEIYENKLSRGWGFNITGDGIGIAYRNFYDSSDNQYTEYIFAGGKNLSSAFTVGASYRYFKKAPDIYHKRHYWNIGIYLHPMSKFSYAACFSNLNRGKTNGSRSEIEQLYSVTFRATKNISLSTELSLYGGQSLSDADYNYGVDVYPMPGMTIYANFRDRGGFEIGLRLNLTQYFVGGQSRYGNGNEHVGTSVYAGYVAGKQPSIINPGTKKTNN